MVINHTVAGGQAARSGKCTGQLPGRIGRNHVGTGWRTTRADIERCAADIQRAGSCKRITGGCRPIVDLNGQCTAAQEHHVARVKDAGRLPRSNRTARRDGYRAIHCPRTTQRSTVANRDAGVCRQRTVHQQRAPTYRRCTAVEVISVQHNRAGGRFGQGCAPRQDSVDATGLHVERTARIRRKGVAADAPASQDDAVIRHVDIRNVDIERTAVDRQCRITPRFAVRKLQSTGIHCRPASGAISVAERQRTKPHLGETTHTGKQTAETDVSARRVDIDRTTEGHVCIR